MRHSSRPCVLGGSSVKESIPLVVFDGSHSGRFRTLGVTTCMRSILLTCSLIKYRSSLSIERCGRKYKNKCQKQRLYFNNDISLVDGSEQQQMRVLAIKSTGVITAIRTYDQYARLRLLILCTSLELTARKM